MEPIEKLLNLIQESDRSTANSIIDQLFKKQTEERDQTAKELNQARQAALNMMEDAVLAKEKLELTQFAVDHLGDATFRIGKDGLFVEVNQAACQALGYTEEELLGLHVSDISPEWPKERWGGHWKELAEKKHLRFEALHQRKNGETFPVELQVNYVRFGQKEYSFTFAHDITSRKQAEKQIQFEQNLFREFMETIPALIFFKDLDGRIVRANRALAEYHNTDPQLLIGKSDFDFYPEEAAQDKLREEQQVMKTRQPIQIEELDHDIWRMTTKAPRYNVDGEIIGTFGISLNITEQKNAQQAVEESESRYHDLFENMTSGFALNEMIYDETGNPVNYRFLQINPAFERQTGLSAKNIIGKTVLEVLPGTEPSWIENYGRVVKTGEPIAFENYSKDLDRHYGIRAFCPVPGQFAVIITDITEQKLAEKKIAFEQKLFHNFMDAVPASIYFKDRESRFIKINKAGCAKFREEEIIGKTDFDLSAKEDAQKFRDTELQILETGEMIQAEEQNNGHWYLSTKAPWYDESGKLAGVFGIAFDITERKNAQQAVEESETRFKSLHDASFGGIAIHDQGIILECNQGLSIMTGYSEEELIGMNGLGLIAESSRDLVMSHIQSGYEKSYEATGLRKNGEQYPLRLEARNVSYKGKDVRTVEFRDITDQKKAETELQRLSTAIEQSPEAVVITDPNGIIQYVNPAFEETTGYSREEAIGASPRILKSGQHDAAFYSNLWKTINSGKIWEGRFINKRKDGSVYTEEASISPVRNATGDITGYAAIKRDITKELEQEEQMQQAQKMEAVGQLAGGIAHDFNNILQAVLGFSELLMLTLDPELEQPRSNVMGIQKAAKHAADLTRQLLAFSRKQDLELTYMDINQSVKRTSMLITSIIGEKIKVISTLEPNLNPAKADSQQIDRMLLNLALNARDAMPDGGELTLRTENAEFSKEDNQSSAQIREGNFVCLSVSDNGTGMSEETQQHIFEPFFTTKEPGKGTGLGLAAIYGIIQKHDGWISVYSELDQGTTFKVFLPVYDAGEPLPTVHNDSNTPDDVHGWGERILIVENDCAVLDLSMNALRRAGYTVETATSVEEAERLFDEADEAFDLLCSDMTLPDNNGADLAEALTKKQPGLAVLLCSGYSGKRIREDEIKQKGFFFLEKPFSIVNLLKQVHRALHQKKRN